MTEWTRHLRRGFLSARSGSTSATCMTSRLWWVWWDTIHSSSRAALHLSLVRIHLAFDLGPYSTSLKSSLSPTKRLNSSCPKMSILWTESFPDPRTNHQMRSQVSHQRNAKNVSLLLLLQTPLMGWLLGLNFLKYHPPGHKCQVGKLVRCPPRAQDMF